MKEFRVERLEKQSRDEFDCGNEQLNNYLLKRSGQDQRSLFAACYLLIDQNAEKIAGYYTLSSASISLTLIPSDLAKKLPRYPSVPAVRVGRLAVDLKYQGSGLGKVLLADVVKRVIQSGIGSYAILVDAIDDQAEAFYLKFGFQKLKLATDDRMLFLPIKESSIEQGS